MKKIYYGIFLLISSLYWAQLGINTRTPDASAALDVYATDKGVSFPKISLQNYSDLSTINAPAESLLIYNTNGNLLGKQGYYFWNGAKWDYFFSDLNEENLKNQTKTYSATSATPYTFTRAASQFYGYTAHVAGEVLNTAQWTVINDLTKTIVIDRPVNDVLMNVSGMFQANNGAANSTSGIRTTIGFFIDDKLVDVKPMFMDFQSTCSFRPYAINGNVKNLTTGNHTVKFAIRNISAPAITGLTVTYGGPNTSCSSQTLSAFESSLSGTIFINQPYVF